MKFAGHNKERALRRDFPRLLAALDIRNQSVSIRRDDTSGTLASMSFDDDSITLIYTRALLAQLRTRKELEAVLKHEICHVLTAPSSAIEAVVYPVPEATLARVEYVDIYREYLAHREFCSRFPEDKEVFIAYGKRVFDVDSLLQEVREACDRADDVVRPFVFFGGIFRAYYDAVYFHLVDDATFSNWCRKTGWQVLYETFLCAIGDMAHIDARDAAYASKIQLVGESFQLFFNVSINDLVSSNRIVLLKDPAKIADSLDSELVALWQARGFSTLQ